MEELQSARNILSDEIQKMQQDIKNLEVKQEATSQRCQALEDQYGRLATVSLEIPYLFMLPDKYEWFSGRESELENLDSLLKSTETISETKVQIASVCGLGGTGKTSLAAEYAHRSKDYFGGGVFWFSGENSDNFARSVEEHAVPFGTSHDASPYRTLLKTLEKISAIEKPWLLVLDNMDEFDLSPNMKILLSGPWKGRVKGSGHILITTRRQPKVMGKIIRNFKKSKCLQLGCFSPEDGKLFVFKRTGLICDNETSAKASKLVETLGGLPLALEQACAYVSNLSCDLTEYLEHYKKFSLELLDEEDATSVTLCESPERLAVRTTWLLNFDYIKKSTKGNIAVRFLHACAFFNPNEIQQELINPGKPPIEDEAYREYVDTPLGSSLIFKLLTDFSLFKKGKSSSLTVHHLVQEVIREELKSSDAEISSLVDAIRFLSFAFSKCPSPDGLVDSDIKSRHDRASISATNPFLFHTWQTLCLHAQEVLSNFKSFQVLDERILGPETARIIYELALDLNVRSKTDEARECFNFAHKIIDLSKAPLTESELASLFPREVPLPESLRRYIFYSCATPRDSTDSSTSDGQERIGSKRKMEEMQVNSDFRYQDSSAMAEANSVEPNLLYDRALAYIHSKQYKNALAESENYILKRPTCWLGFCTKALALHGLNELWEANSFAALAFYYNRNVFRECQLFNDVFSTLEKRIHICDTSSRLTDVLMKQTSQLQADSESPSRIIIIEPGDYVVNSDDLSTYSSQFFFKRFLSFGLLIDDCILLGVDRTKSSVVTLKNSHPELRPRIGEQCHDCVFWRNVMVSNISFVISGGNWESQSDSTATWTNCSFSSILKEDKSNIFRCLGTDTFRSCKFENCAGLLTLGRTVLQKCVFSGSESSGVHVNKSARLEMKECKVFGNETGIFIEKAPESCNVTNCDIFDNKWEGVSIHEATTNVKVENCRIYQNNRNGISVQDSSSAIVSKNEIFENGWRGISTVCNGRCTVSHNKIYGNKSGGVQVVPVEKPLQPSIVQFNEIFENRGHDIYCEITIRDTPTETSVNLSSNGLQQLDYFHRNTDMFERAKCNKNKCYNNEDQDRSHKSDDYSDYCFYCRKKCSKKCKKCKVATYCNKECQKHDWEKHKKECRGLLKKSTVCLDIPEKEGLDIAEHGICLPETSPQHPGLAPKGELFFSPPKSGDTFLVKLLAADEEWHSNSDGPVFTICDRSRTINGVLDRKCYSKLFNIVRECGINSTFVDGWKKKFFWALHHEKDQTKLRVFVTKFPPHQDW